MESLHWADQAARNVIRVKGDKETYTVAAGITPSGIVHVGNFREVVTQSLIAKALQGMGKKVRFIYSWDDYDVFRKVPVNMPNQEMLAEYLRMPITEVPDTFECKHKSYAEHNEAVFEKELKALHILPEFIHQYKKYKKCEYAEEIKKALEKKDKIKKILNKGRKEELEENWLPVMVFCDKCNKDTLSVTEWKGGYNIYYECECGHKEEFDFRKKGIIKLLWRVDWPMRWSYEKVDFESAGKDHFASGGSFEMGKEICKEVYGCDGPEGFMYEWISIKGGKTLHSSTGNVVKLGEVLEIYEPDIVLYLFAGTRPNSSFAISFDLDVLKIYEDFDKCERIYFNKELAKDEKEYVQQKRIYELSSHNISAKQPVQPIFRHLTTLIQVYNDDFAKIRKHFEKELKSKFDEDRLKQRTALANNWLLKHAPEDFKFRVQDEISDETKERLSQKEINALRFLKKVLDKAHEEKTLHNEFYDVSQEAGIEPKEFFKAAYLVLIGKEKGPKLASFVLEIGVERVKKLLDKL